MRYSKSHQDSEHQHQVALFAWADLPSIRALYPDLDLLFAVPNGGYRRKATGGRLKAEGVRRGVADIFLDVARCGHHGLRIELKAKGGSTSQEQRAWIARWTMHGYQAVVSFGWEDARREIIEYITTHMREAI